MASFKEIKNKITGTSAPSGHHLAAILPSQGGAFELTHRLTPTPGPDELLIEVKSIALNPLDFKQQDYGFFIAAYPTVLGSDIGGVVVSKGSAVSSDAAEPGTRVAAFAPGFFMQSDPDHGAFQTHVLVPAALATPLPQGISFNEASLLPAAVLTAWSGWYSIGVPRDTAYTTADKKGMLVWGGASSIGTAAVQTAKSMGFTVYATASEKHHEYLKDLGVSKAFDYRGDNVVKSIISAAKEDGITIELGFDAVGEVNSCVEILRESKGTGIAKLASAIPLSPDQAKVEGVEVKFIAAPIDEKERTQFFYFVFRVWLKEKLERGNYVPSPKIQVIQGGLESVGKALDHLRKGVSGTKLVLEVE